LAAAWLNEDTGSETCPHDPTPLLEPGNAGSVSADEDRTGVV
jgi:hypothetical protein